MSVQTENILSDYTEKERTAYISTLAALATADREASEEEVEHLREVAQAAGISPQLQGKIIDAGRDSSGTELKQHLDTLKGSNLRYSLVTDLIALAKADGAYGEEERSSIEKVSKYLGVNQDQFSALDQYVDKAVSAPEQASQSNFLDSSGLKDQFSRAGIGGSTGRGLLGVLAPMILGGLAGRMMGGRGRAGGGLGGMLGGALGGTLARGGGFGLPGGLGGGLGSLISGMSRSRSSGGLGGLLGKLM